MQERLAALERRLDERDGELAAAGNLAALEALRAEGERLLSEVYALRAELAAGLQEAAATRHFATALDPAPPRPPAIVEIKA
jgi:hypothetical protein